MSSLKIPRSGSHLLIALSVKKALKFLKAKQQFTANHGGLPKGFSPRVPLGKYEREVVTNPLENLSKGRRGRGNVEGEGRILSHKVY